MKKVFLFICAFAVLFVTACTDDDNQVKQSEVTVDVRLPEDYEELSRDSILVVLKNSSTGVSYSGKTGSEGTVKLTVEEGIYDISGSVEKQSDASQGETLVFQGGTSGTSVSGIVWTHRLQLQLSARNKEWLFREIYITASKTTAGKNYQKDRYFAIYNNTDKVLDASGLSIGETYQTTAAKNPLQNPADWKQFWPDRVVVGSIYTVPGDKPTLIQPGGNLVLADLAVNHTLPEYQSTSKADLSKANYEWYDESNNTDSDVPEVPNMLVTYNSANIWIPNSQGNKSYVIFKADDQTLEQLLQDNHITNVLKPNGKDYYDTYAVPVKYIYDGVEFSSNSASIADKALPNSIDAGFTYSTGLGSGTVVRRKVARWDGDRAILQDTNDSTADFEADKEPQPYVVVKDK